MILYAPIIDTNVPAYTEGKLTVHFQHNAAVDPNSVDSIKVIVKDFHSNKILKETTTTAFDCIKGEAIFEYAAPQEYAIKKQYKSAWVWEEIQDEPISDAKNWCSYIKRSDGNIAVVMYQELNQHTYYTFSSREAAEERIDTTAGSSERKAIAYYATPGNFYKIQIAYVDPDKQVGPFSTVGVTRWLGNENSIEISINGLKENNLIEHIFNPNLIEYYGNYKYNQTGLSEPVYQYKYELIENNDIIETSEWLLPQRDAECKPIMRYVLQNELKYFVNYTLRFTILTANGYCCSKDYEIAKRGLYPSFLTGNLIVTQEPAAKENGYVHIYLDQTTILTNGVFRLIRRENYSENWDELVRFNMDEKDSLSIFSWKDYSVEQGRKYYYAIQQCGLTSDDTPVPYYSTIVKAHIDAVEFEHMFLGDDKFQLKLAFNPQISSFKETVLESKVEAIGGQYPFFFRNGKVRYKEIPISGLISYLLDDEGHFLKTNELFSPQETFIHSTALTNTNFAVERQFKLKILDWLNNGKPKLFRSPAEGNYVVRLMSVSMSPNAQVGRMLHTVSATGYEVMEPTIKKMLEQKIIEFSNINSQFDGSINDYGDLIAQGEYVYYSNATNNTSDVEQLDQLCALLFDNRGNNIQYTVEGIPLTDEPITILANDYKPYIFDTPVKVNNFVCNGPWAAYGWMVNKA